MWKDGLMQNMLEVFEKISKLECIKDFYLCGSSGIALLLNHRCGEVLDFELLNEKGRIENSESLNHEQLIAELRSQFDNFKMGEMVSEDYFECFVENHVKLSFYKPQYKVPVLNEVAILNNLKTVSLQDALGMKLYLVTQRSNFRDYYDIYSLLKAGCSLGEGIYYALKFARHDISSKYIISKLLSDEFFVRTNGEDDFDELKPQYHVDASQIRIFIEEKLKQVQITKTKIDVIAHKSIGRLFYETFKKLDDIQLLFVFDKLLNYKKTKSVGNRLDFLVSILSSVGVKVVPYDLTNEDLSEIRMRKDIESLSKIDSILSEYKFYQELNSEIKQQNDVIKDIQTFQMDFSLKKVIINNSLIQIESLQEQKQRLYFLKEFERIEKQKSKTQSLETLQKK